MIRTGKSKKIIQIMDKNYYCSAVYKTWNKNMTIFVEGEFAVFPIVDGKVDFGDEVVDKNFEMSFTLMSYPSSLIDTLIKMCYNELVDYTVGVSEESYIMSF